MRKRRITETVSVSIKTSKVIVKESSMSGRFVSELRDGEDLLSMGGSDCHPASAVGFTIFAGFGSELTKALAELEEVFEEDDLAPQVVVINPYHLGIGSNM